jgi:hypothetical protein
MSALAKLSVGPLRSKPCRSCGRNLSVSRLPYTLIGLVSTLLPFVGVVLGASFAGGSVSAVLLCVAVSAIPALWLHYRYVPFIVRGSSDSVRRMPNSEQ